MKRLPAVAGLSSALLLASPAGLPAQTADGIVERMERNIVFETARSVGSMIVRDRFGARESTFVSYSKGDSTTFVEFTSAEERGMKILRTSEGIYLYYPDAAELIRLQGAALRDAVLGSDMSYEDLTGGKGLLKSYRAKLEGTETIDGRLCYRIALEASRRDVPYYRQTLWVDTELLVFRRAAKFARSGTLLKEIEVSEIRRVSGRNVPTRMTVKDALKRGSSTELIVKEIEIDPQLPPKIFSLGELTW